MEAPVTPARMHSDQWIVERLGATSVAWLPSGGDDGTLGRYRPFVELSTEE